MVVQVKGEKVKKKLKKKLTYIIGNHISRVFIYLHG